MKLLITTQAVDKNDPILGFFHRWIGEFANHCEEVHVICLREGKHTLPKNVHIHSLGKEDDTSRLERMRRFFSYIIALRKDYDAVLVHMNPEYLVLAGWLWRLFGKKTALWYTHKHVDLKLRAATFFTHVVFTASRESFRLGSKKVQVMGHGIDTDFFQPDPSISRGDWFLSVGRLMQSKRHDLAIRIVADEKKELRIAGDGPLRQKLEEIAREYGSRVHFLGGLTQTELRDEYRKAALLIHTSETGSLDKVVLEALACGLKIRTTDPALKFLENEGPEYVRSHHSLTALIPAIIQKLHD